MLNKFFFILAGTILIHVFILTKLIYFPYPELFIYPYLTNHGLKPYAQILDQHFPGLMFLPVNLDNLEMNTPQVARVWSVAIVVLIQIMLFLIASKLLKSRTKALLVNILYLIWQPFFEGWVLWIDNFLPLFLLPAFYFFYRRKYFLSGILIGLAILFKQTIIPLAVFILIFVFWETRRLKESARFLLGSGLPLVFIIFYFARMGVIDDFFYWTVVFNLTTYAKYGSKLPPSLGFVTRVAVVYSASLLAFFHKEKRLTLSLLIFLVGSLVGVFDRAEFVHFQPSLPFVVLMSTLGVYSILKNNLIKIGIMIYIFITIWWQQVFYKGHWQNKVILFDDHTYALADKIRNYAKPGEKIFAFGVVPHIYQLTNTLPAGDIFVFQFPWFMKVAEDRILEGIKKDLPEIIVSEASARIEGGLVREFAPKINEYIIKNYQKIDQTGATEILRRKS